MLYVYTPEVLKKEIDMMVEKHGYKFFLLSTSRDGFYMMGIENEDVFNDQGRRECAIAIKRRKDEVETETKET